MAQFLFGKNAEPRALYQTWLPEWRAVVGPLVECGKMQLSRQIFQMKKALLVDEFSIFIKPTRLHIGLKIKKGEAFLEQRLVNREQVPPGTPRELIWCWRRVATMYSLDDNTAPPEIECFFLGWETRPKDGQITRYGFKIFGDGRHVEDDLKKASV